MVYRSAFFELQLALRLDNSFGAVVCQQVLLGVQFDDIFDFLLLRLTQCTLHLLNKYGGNLFSLLILFDGVSHNLHPKKVFITCGQIPAGQFFLSYEKMIFDHIILCFLIRGALNHYFCHVLLGVVFITCWHRLLS